VGASDNPATFAFYANKQMTTGEGGMLVTRDGAMAKRARSERNQGRAENMNVIEHDRIGFNYRLTDLQAAIGIAQMERFHGILRERERIALNYRAQLTEIGAVPPGEGEDEGLLLPCEDTAEARRSWFVFCVQLPADADRNRVINNLMKQGIASKAYLPCIHLMPPYRERFGFKGGEFPIAERVAERSLALPFFTAMSEGQVERVCETLAETLEGLGT
jgi:perosamine synthetase